ncbi:helix-turn-helix transcriptional regulator [Gracilibacillus thailandensis]|uniref:DeoR family transcriptional regulator n=1 Tax=Gracilibacillus thailandensis TaxID=563735 RepID=A0A6N7R4B0_9BACI|nr:metalloregulator ArsR/SmtB family transcription factor [Gracilibacillus thailandensis]MRI68063.1 DeoR family transcriptional regulator [Gracilibacillus thailandensis]
MAKKQSTKAMILELLKKNQSLSVNGISNFLNITEMAIRKHLIKLESEKLINSRTVRQPMGRPVSYYSLTRVGENVFPKNYDLLTMEFLRDIEETIGMEAIDQLFERREERLRQKYRRRIFIEEPIAERVKALVKVQSDNGYMSEFHEEDKDQLSFSQYNCPIAAIADKYDKPCDCELNLFKSVLGTEKVKRVECIAKGGTACKYVVEK